MKRLLILAVLLSLPLTAQAQTQNELQNDAERVVSKGAGTVQRLREDKDFPQLWEPKLQAAKAVLLVPEQYKAGFILGAEYGVGALLVRGADGTFSDPAFYRLYAGSVGLQIGGQKAETLFLIMTDAGLSAILDNKFKAGADIGVSIAHKGAGMEASTTTNLDADIYAYSHAMGLYGGGSLEGTVIEPDPELNAAYFGDPGATPNSILFERGHTNPYSAELKGILVH